jgi:hypothetical protein
VTQPLQLAIPPVGLRQGAPERLLLRLGQLLQVAEGDQGEQGGDGGEQQTNGVVLSKEPQPQPRDDDRDADDRSGVRQPPPAVLEAGGQAAYTAGNTAGGQRPGAQRVSAVRIW